MSYARYIRKFHRYRSITATPRRADIKIGITFFFHFWGWLDPKHDKKNSG